MSKRDAAVAGFFYPGAREGLLAEVDRCLEGDSPRERASMVVLPHAGYVFSGGGKAVASPVSGLVKGK
ncbi:MAG: AmmeMemoRadiSam system protein B [Polyangia bacterium]